VGTNYYWHDTTEPICPRCKHRNNGLHIGKSSAGWHFKLNVHRALGISTYADWMERMLRPGTTITNEYDQVVTVDEMRFVIEDRSGGGPRQISGDWLARNSARVGLDGLASDASVYCVGRVSGQPIDLVEGDFT